MKKGLLLIALLLSHAVWPQQNMKRITDTGAKLVIELFSFRNGTEPGNVVGDSNFSIIIEDDRLAFHDPTGALTYLPGNASPPMFPANVNAPYCNGTFDPIMGIGGKFYTFEDGSNTLPITVLELPTHSDALEDNNTVADLYIVKLELPKTLNGSASIPVNTWFTCKSTAARDYITQQVILPGKRLGYQFDGTDWLPRDVDWNGVAFDAIPSLCQPLGVEDAAAAFDVTLFPMPAGDQVEIHGKALSGPITYRIADMMGRTIKSGQTGSVSKIEVGDLTSGHYIVQITNQSNQSVSKKLIKK